MSQRVRILGTAICAAVAICGCGEDRYFKLSLQLPLPPNCPSPPGGFGYYSVIVQQGNDPADCVQNECTIANEDPRDCLVDVETPPLDPGRALRVRVMLFEAPPGVAPVMCGERVLPDVDFDTVRMDISLECPATCTFDSCDPGKCATERDRWCGPFFEE